MSDSFTLKVKCICGCEFYFSMSADEYPIATRKMGSEKYDIFIEEHRRCWLKQLEELPDDWKL